MKVYSIGRGEDCSIILDDPSISRCHALLRVYPFGRMEIVNVGASSTYVNGVKISSNEPFPVKRSDVISFARVKQLDWDLVAKPMVTYLMWVVGSILGFTIISVISLFAFSGMSTDESSSFEVVTTSKDGGESKSQKKGDVTIRNEAEHPEATNFQKKDVPSQGASNTESVKAFSPSDKAARDSALAKMGQFFPNPSLNEDHDKEGKAKENKSVKSDSKGELSPGKQDNSPKVSTSQTSTNTSSTEKSSSKEKKKEQQGTINKRPY